MLLELGAVHSMPLAQAALRVVAVHGLTDALTPYKSHLSLYLLVMLPWPSTLPFAAASVAHFSRDIGLGGSVMLHASWAAFYAVRGPEVATSVALLYLTVVHLPCHYLRTLKRTTSRRWVLPMAGVSAAALLLPITITTLCDWMQRLICVHVALEEWHR